MKIMKRAEGAPVINFIRNDHWYKILCMNAMRILNSTVIGLAFLLYEGTI